MEQIITEKQNSIKLSKGMNGNYAWEVKIYFDENPYKIIEEVKKIDEDLKSKFNEKEVK